MDWGNPGEVTELQQKIEFLTHKKKIKLVDVVNVMLHCRILPLQPREGPMWAFKPKDAVHVKHFFRTSLSGMWMPLFKPSLKEFPLEGRNDGFEAAHDASAISICSFTFCIPLHLVNLN